MAAERGLAACGSCAFLSKLEDVDAGSVSLCPRCGARLRMRRPDSLERTGALLLAAAICYVPANVLPVLATTNLGVSEADTILGGVARLYQTGSWILAIIVLVASVAIPLAKMATLAGLLLVANRRVPANRRLCVRLYRVLEIIGRWSMLDVFVAALVVAVVQLRPLVSATPGPGLAFFAATAVLTMLAARAFDPRLVWETGRRADVSAR
jgi:paraquat-inducible protein A